MTAILALQKMHLSDKHLVRIAEHYGHRFTVFHSPDPSAPNARGVAFVVNTSLIRVTNAHVRTLVPGRAILLSIPWQNDRTLHLLNVYAPNDPTENQHFWSQLLEHWTTNHSPLPKADIMLGDFNLVKDELDCLPPYADHIRAVVELNALKTCLGLYNGWHTTYPDK
ncbi:uncharacterized protein PHACADRAFT_33754 [Phanerochaete carnosa HHB-10118-sp]|uniref:Endonuclease/exonuclease/phosphatase domain-containing protein n=1 Tax=Phanerochaete carnosa (strain HHB-10118-sp) TaxID=650164 RepID=K5WF14_PHACS|nr:uncharacterized protein PHACADRAFT_33754 [Phanerochaete carnosa HHB-10118-sp]EKM48762.1 hypothetical protein PHACADRAFT_33754 [Phanerochaete carnosa HHB-10118-sp]